MTLPLEVWTLEQRLDHLFKQTSELPENPEVQANWARYLCVLVSGYIEVAAIAIYTEYAANSASPQVARFVSGRLASVANANWERYLQLLGSFDKDMRDALEAMNVDGTKEAFDAVVANRNQIAHGKDTGITFHRIKEYYSKIQKEIHRLSNDILPGAL